jgi:hypothetical protein
MGELPSGTISMLFSDIEQSTRLLTRLGRAYEQALDGCRAAQRAAWGRFTSAASEQRHPAGSGTRREADIVSP